MKKLALLAALALLGACSPLYVIRAGYEEAKLLSRRESIAKLVRDSATAPELREKLRLVVRARSFAQDSLGLETGDSYTTFAKLDSDTLAMIVSAAYKDRFQPYTWWFPIIGRVPYKGYFSEKKARQAVADLEAKGFDTYLRPTTAFSTLGWFNDPLVSPLLRYDSVSLGSTVIHELLHNTVYLPGQTAFNESFAEFVGSRGAIQMFCGGAGEGSGDCRMARALWHDELLYGAFLSGMVSRLDTLYGRADLPSAEKVRLREEIFSRAQRTFADSVRPSFQVASYSSFSREPLNNAFLLAHRLYYNRLDLFEALYQRQGGKLRETVQAVLEATKGGGDPYAKVAALLRPPD
jgi:predicted aminopeptidase